MSFELERDDISLNAHAGELPILEHDDCDAFDEIADIINETYA